MAETRVSDLLYKLQLKSDETGNFDGGRFLSLCRTVTKVVGTCTCWGSPSVNSGAGSALGGSRSLPFRFHIVRNHSCCTATANCLFAPYLSIIIQLYTRCSR